MNVVRKRWEEGYMIEGKRPKSSVVISASSGLFGKAAFVRGEMKRNVDFMDHSYRLLGGGGIKSYRNCHKGNLQKNEFPKFSSDTGAHIEMSTPQAGEDDPWSSLFFEGPKTVEGSSSDEGEETCLPKSLDESEEAPSVVDEVEVKPMLTSPLSKMKPWSWGPLRHNPHIKNFKSASWNNKTREELAVPGARGFSISGFIPETVCKYMIANTNELGYQSVHSEFDPRYRNNERVMVYSKELADYIWARLATYFTRKDVYQIVPIGFGNEGTWKPLRINECVKFSKYLSGTHFSPHIDGPWIPTWDEASVYTVLVYLNNDFEGGETQFVKGDELVAPEISTEVITTIKPEAGKCLVFTHNALHQSLPITKGVKYVLRTEVIFQKIDGHLQAAPHAYETDPQRLKMVTLYKRSQEKLDEGDPKEFMDLYFECLKLQVEAMRSVLPPPPELTNLFPLEIFLHIFSFLTPKELTIAMSVCKEFYEIALSGEIWKELAISRIHEEHLRIQKEPSRYGTRDRPAQVDLTSNHLFDLHVLGTMDPYVVDWYGKYKLLFQTRPQVSTGIMDIRPNIVHFIDNLPYVGHCGHDPKDIWGAPHVDKLISGGLRIKSAPPLYRWGEKWVSVHYRRSTKALDIGSGSPLLVDSKSCKDWESILMDYGINCHMIFIRHPGYDWTTSHKAYWMTCIDLHAAIATLYKFDTKTALIVSLEDNLSYFSFVRDLKVEEDYVCQTQGSREDKLADICTNIAKASWKGCETLDCCCIGQDFDSAELVNEFVKKNAQQGLKLRIISTIQDRVFAPVQGALMYPFKHLKPKKDLKGKRFTYK